MDEKLRGAGEPRHSPAMKVWAPPPNSRRRSLLLWLLLAVAALVCGWAWFESGPPRGERQTGPSRAPVESEAPRVAINANPDVAPTPDRAQPNAQLAEFLSRRVDVQFAGAYPREVANWLWSRTGLEVALPGALAGRRYFTLKAAGVTLREVVERLAEAAGFRIEYHGQTVVFWGRADDAVLPALAKELEARDPQARCEAVCDLAALPDPRIYPLLFRALEDPDDSVFHWTAWALEAQHLPTLGFGAGVERAREALERRLGKLLSTPPKALCVLGATRLPQAVESLTARLAQARPTEWAIHARALAATRRPEAVPRLTDPGPMALS